MQDINKIEYEDLFQDKKIFDSIGQGRYYSELYPCKIKEQNKKKTRFLKYLINFYQDKKRFTNEKKNILFLEHRFSRIADVLSDSYNIYLLHDSIKIYREFRNKGYHQHFYRTWMKCIDKSYITHDMTFAEKAACGVERYFAKNNINLVIVGNDKRFMERLIMIVAKRMLIPTVVIQHGAYTDEWSFGKLKTANTADIFWTWSDYIKDCYVKRFNKNPDSVTVIGYPFELLNDKPNKKTVLFLGNNYKNTNYDEGIGYIRIAKLVLKVCDELDVNFLYRPHPGEEIDELEYGELINYIRKNTTLLEDLKLSSIVIGDFSSAMIEASLCNRKVVQVVWSDRSKETLKDPMYSFTYKTSDNYDDIKITLKKCIEDKNNSIIDDYYMHKELFFEENIKKNVERIIDKSLNVTK